MPPATTLLYVPILHQELGHSHPCPTEQAAFFWPGLPLPANTPVKVFKTFTPGNYPFSPKEAAACLADIRDMGEAALSGVPLQAFIHPQKTRAELKDVQEQEALKNFMNTGQEPACSNTPSVHEYRQGQKFLLWAWLMEEHLLEVKNLTENYTLSAANLTSALEAEKDEALSGLELIQTILSTDTFALPPWRLVMENMALFLPEDSTVIINHPEMIDFMLEEKEALGLTPLSPEQGEELGFTGLTAQGHVLMGRVSYAQLLAKKTAANTSPWLEKKLSCIIIKDGLCLK